MNPDLVRPSRFDAALDEGEILESLRHFVIGSGWFSTMHDGHFLRMGRVRTKRLVNQPLLLVHHAFHQGEVDFLHRPIHELFGKFLVRLLRFGKNQNAAGLPVESVNGENLTELVAEHVVQIGLVRRKTVGNGEQVGGFVHHDEVVVLVNYFYL